MKLLLLADLHGRVAWFAWAARQKVDVICIAGDLLDGLSKQGLLPQILEVQASMQKARPPLVLSSGNHDANRGDGIFSPDALECLSDDEKEKALPFLTATRWMDVWSSDDCVVDGKSRVLKTGSGALVVTTVPYDFGTGTDHSGLWNEGAKLRKSEGCPWLVLHHEPPADTEVGGLNGDPNLFWKIREFQPNFVLSGHIHDQPYRGSFADRVDSTWCFNPGRVQPKQAQGVRIPNHIILDTNTREAVWNHECFENAKAASKTIPLGRTSNGAVW